MLAPTVLIFARWSKFLPLNGRLVLYPSPVYFPLEKHFSIMDSVCLSFSLFFEFFFIQIVSWYIIVTCVYANMAMIRTTTC